MKWTALPGCSTARLGTLVTASGSRLETPRAALPTSSGAVPHLTRGVLDRVLPEPQLLLAPMSSCLHLETGAKALGRGLAAFVAARPQDAWLVVTDDASVETPDGHFEKDGVPLWTRHGKQLVDPARYMSLVRLFAADASATLADTRAHPAAARKRLTRAAQRTKSALRACLDKHDGNTALYGAVAGWGCQEALESCVSVVCDERDRLSGVTLVGLLAPHEAPFAAAKDLPEQLPDVVRRLSRCAVAAPGRWSPAAACALISAGVDLLDASVATRLADTGHACVFPFHEQNGRNFGKQNGRNFDKQDGRNFDKQNGENVDKQNGEDVDKKDGEDVDKKDGEDVDKQDSCSAILDLNDERYRMDFSPLLSDCTCLSCRSHTRAYIHHLLRTRELLAPVLLTIHNLHHYTEFMAAMRCAIASDTLPAFQEHLNEMHATWVRQHPPVAHDKRTEKHEKRKDKTDKQGCKRAHTPSEDVRAATP